MIPKIRGLTHDHVDGCAVLKQLIFDLYRLAGRKFPFASSQEWVDFFQNPQEDIIRRFRTVTDVLQSDSALEQLGYAYGTWRAQEGYVYVEAKFAPQYHTDGGLTIRQAADAMCRGLWRAEGDYGIRILPQLCIGREAAPEVGLEVARACLEYDGAVALDLACGEAGNPPEKHRPAFDLTAGTKVRRDCHTGEWVEAEPTATYRQRLLRNVRTAVRELKADAISHAIPLADDSELVRRVVGAGIRVSGCPAAYAAARLISDIRDLKIPELLDAGVCYTLNADDDLFLPPMPEVIAACATEAVGLTAAHWRQLAENPFRGALAANAGKYR